MVLLSDFENKTPSKRAISCRTKVLGKGVNDANFITCLTVDGRTVNHPAYDIWSAMLNRCYSSSGRMKNPTYSDVIVCDAWLSFSCFFQWYKANHKYDWHLDKDLLSDSREYGPETCIFVPRVLNNFLTDSMAVRGPLPIGCTYRPNGKIRCRVNNPVTGDRESLGEFIDVESAVAARLRRKLEIAFQLKEVMDSVDLRIYPRVVSLVERQR